MRAVHVDGKRIPYEIRGTTVIFHLPGDKKRPVSATELMHNSWSNIERDIEKGNFHITPSEIRQYVIDTGIDMLFDRN